MESRSSDILKQIPVTMSPQKKEEIANQILTRITQEKIDITKILHNAALFLIPFPSELSQVLSHLQKALEGGVEDKTLDNSKKLKLFEAVSILIDNEFSQAFLKHLQNKNNIKIFDLRLLYFIHQSLKLEYKPEPLVEAGIKHGKIYWRIIENKKVIYTRPNHEEKFNFNEEEKKNNTWVMYWDQFRVFKDSGKRSGTVEITEDRFVAEFKKLEKDKDKAIDDITEDEISNGEEQQKDKPDKKTEKPIKVDKHKILEEHIAYKIWVQLKAQGILNHRHRLSNQWRAISNKDVSLCGIDDTMLYPIIGEVLFSIATNEEFKESHDSVGKAVPVPIFRSEKVKKKWAATSLVTNAKRQNGAELWEVVTYQIREPTKNIAPVEYDHIPSADALEKVQQSRVEQDQNQKAESKDMWWTIGLPVKLHCLGLTYKSKESYKVSFHDSLKDYFGKLELCPKLDDYFLPQDDYEWRAIGAFRYLYRCQTKQHKDVESFEKGGGKRPTWKKTSINMIGRTSFFLFSQPLKESIDQLFIEKIKSTLGQTQQLQQKQQDLIERVDDFIKLKK